MLKVCTKMSGRNLSPSHQVWNQRLGHHFTVTIANPPCPLYVLSGISGSGKTTLGRKVANVLSAEFVDADDYYLKDKPQVTLSNGAKVANWDCFEAMDPNFPFIIAKKLNRNPVLLVGFALPDLCLPTVPLAHIHLVTATNPEDLSARCKEARLAAKPGLNVEKDALMVDEVVIPFYHEVVAISNFTALLKVYKKGTRRPVEELVDEIRRLIHKPIAREDTIDIGEPYHSLIYAGTKPVEGRKGSPTWTTLQVGDEMFVTCGIPENEELSPADYGAGAGHWYRARITHIARYLPSGADPLGRMLATETLDRLLPGVTSEEEGRQVYSQWSTEEEISKMGVMAISLQPVD